MTKKSMKNVAASVQAKLLARARERKDDFQLLLLRYANERLLFRLASSGHVKSFVLKGAALFTCWTGQPHRATRDLDFLGYGKSTEEHLAKVFTEILETPVVDDGLVFDSSHVKVAPIREDQEYGGVRVTFVARLGNAKVHLQVDVGFGDAVTPGAQEIEFPPLLDFPAPRLRAYPRETVAAEKIEALVKLGIANTRMKDFYDLLTLSEQFEFDGGVLVKALRATFKRRGTAFPKDMPVALTAEFYGDKGRETQWSGFARKAGIKKAGDLATTIARVAAFCAEPLTQAARGDSWDQTWAPGGPWMAIR
jgi:predicted nucleotidyltransferase component of viral defense system